jgi:hypothetical protein
LRHAQVVRKLSKSDQVSVLKTQDSVLRAQVVLIFALRRNEFIVFARIIHVFWKKSIEALGALPGV